MKKRFISLMLSMILIMTMVTPAFAAERTNASMADYETVTMLEDGSTSTIKTFVESNGDVHLQQFVNAQLIEEVVVEHESTKVISTSYQNDKKTVKVLDSNDCIVIQSQTQDQSGATPRASLVPKGTITYENTSGEHKAKVQYSAYHNGKTTYTIISGTYTVVQLAGLLIGGLGLSNAIASEVARTIFNWMGFGTTVLGTFLGNETYAADLTTYTYHMTDIATNFTNTMESERYVITDVNASNNGEIFWDGFSPATCWGDISFAEEVYWHLYGDITWSVVSWS